MWQRTWPQPLPCSPWPTGTSLPCWVLGEWKLRRLCPGWGQRTTGRPFLFSRIWVITVTVFQVIRPSSLFLLPTLLRMLWSEKYQEYISQRANTSFCTNPSIAFMFINRYLLTNYLMLGDMLNIGKTKMNTTLLPQRDNMGRCRRQSNHTTIAHV